MKKDKDISLSLSSSDERLGSVLSRGLAQWDTGDCLEPESIAAVVESTLTGEEKDRILRHLSACDTCYEIFLLTSELQEEETIKQETHKILRLKSLALAASVLIVIFSIYIFFRSEEIPKTSRELLEKSDALKESRGKLLQPKPATESPKSKMAVGKDKEEKKIADHKSAAPPLEYRRRKIQDKASAKPMPEPKKETTRDEEKRIEKKEAEISVSEGIRIEREKQEEVIAPTPTLPKKGVDDARSKRRASKSKAIDRKRAGERYKKMEMATQMAKTEETQQSPYLVVGQAVPVQYQAVQLNQVGQRFDNYIPQKDLGSLFKETIVLSQQLGKEFETVQTEAYKTGNLNEIDSYVKGLEPMITVRVVDDTTYISPNVEWFFSKSAPQSIEYQFFSLARSGWCDNSGLCYEGIKGVRRQLEKKSRLKRKVSESEDTVRRLLVKWQALHPQLSGIFKEVSANTITHLKGPK